MLKGQAEAPARPRAQNRNHLPIPCHRHRGRGKGWHRDHQPGSHTQQLLQPYLDLPGQTFTEHGGKQPLHSTGCCLRVWATARPRHPGTSATKAWPLCKDTELPSTLRLPPMLPILLLFFQNSQGVSLVLICVKRC